MKAVLSIAGSDPSGGAGIQGDLKTCLSLGVYGMSVITALTVQNTCKVKEVSCVEASLVGKQLDAVLEDIRPEVIKIGMVGSKENVEVISEKLSCYSDIPVILDPILVSTSGHVLLDSEAEECLKELLFPRATLLTPNLPEAEHLLEKKISLQEDVEVDMQCLSKKCGTSILLKGGHKEGTPVDFLYNCQQKKLTSYHGSRIINPNTHGTGCTLSSAISAFLARGYSLEEAVKEGKAYVEGAIQDQMNLGKGRGPLNHGYLFYPTGKENERYYKDEN